MPCNKAGYTALLRLPPRAKQTDHRALQWLTRAKETNARLLRWSLALQLYDFTVEHRKGKDNANADTLSRMESPCCAQEKEEGVWQRGNAHVATPGQLNGPMNEEDSICNLPW